MEKTVLAGRGGDGVVMRRKKEVKRRERKLSVWRGKHPPKTLTYLGLGTTSNKNTHTLIRERKKEREEGRNQNKKSKKGEKGRKRERGKEESWGTHLILCSYSTNL